MAQIAFQGNAGRDPEVKFFDDGTAVTKTSIAESHSRFNKQSQAWEEIGTTWHNVTVRGKRGESFAATVQKGTRVTIIGKQQSRTYEKDGEQKTFTEVLVDDFGIVPSSQAPAPTQQPSPQGEGFGGQSGYSQPQGGFDPNQVPF